jgi:hypothetical protein
VKMTIARTARGAGGTGACLTGKLPFQHTLDGNERAAGRELLAWSVPSTYGTGAGPVGRHWAVGGTQPMGRVLRVWALAGPGLGLALW